MRETANYGFRKPELNEYLSVEDINHNSDLIDLEFKKANERSDKLADMKTITVPAAGWSAAYPYSQSVSVSGITSDDAPTISCSLAEGLTEEQVKNQAKAFGCLYRAVSGDGNITFYAYKKPAVDFQATLKGV